MITPTLDPRGFSLIHNASPLSKLSWLMAITLSASLFNGFIPLSMLVVETVVLYAVLWAGKETPAPPVLRLVLGVGLLLFLLNLLFADSTIGRWAQETPGEARVSTWGLVKHASSMALRVVTTMLAFFIFILSTVPRDLARSMERLHAPRWLTEALAIAFRFLPVFEVNLKMIVRANLVRAPGPTLGRLPRRFFVRLGQILFGALVMALSQANTTGQSLHIHGFGLAERRIPYTVASRPLADGLFWLLALAALGAAIFYELFSDGRFGKVAMYSCVSARGM